MKVVSEKHEWTKEDFRRARPAREMLPKSFFDALEARRARGKQKAPTKEQVSLRLDPDVLARFRAGGPGWQGRMNAALRKAAGLK
ncbi:MAG TPA: BrnA antitoxin family protein [Bauldia sp.]|nr:BrnA antitoxin family protein [Bauldia sp.]HVZ13067.1 BrnA antitoxin family protein [Bauldia sp.]